MPRPRFQKSRERWVFAKIRTTRQQWYEQTALTTIRRLRHCEKENRKLKLLVADLTLDKMIFQTEPAVSNVLREAANSQVPAAWFLEASVQSCDHVIPCKLL